jgi:hypothetical protein
MSTESNKNKLVSEIIFLNEKSEALAEEGLDVMTLSVQGKKDLQYKNLKELKGILSVLKENQ